MLDNVLTVDPGSGKKESSMLNEVLTVDPGFNTGLAYWSGNLYPVTGEIHQIKKMKMLNLEKRFEDMWEKFEAIIKVYKPRRCIIESARQWGGSLKSRVASVRGDLIKLNAIIYGYAHVCYKYRIKWKLVKAQEWKGNLPNEALKSRVEMVNGEIYKNEHVLCAVGIGLGEMGLLKWE